MIVTLFLFLIALGALATAAFCAGAETGFLSVSRGRVVHVAREGSARAKIVFSAIFDLGRTTTALLVGNNLASVTYSAATAALTARLFGSSRILSAISSFAVALVLLMLGEFLPKLFCATRPLRRMLMLAPYWQAFARVFVPVGTVVQRAIERLLPKREAKPKMTPEAVLKILEDRKDGVKLSDFESALIRRLMQLRAKGEFVVPETLLPALDDKAL